MTDLNNISKEDLLYKIQEINFSLIELSLYLDTHPDDTKAIYFHNQKANELKCLEDFYQRNYGPLTIECPCNKWHWSDEPWPWEKGGNC